MFVSAASCFLLLPFTLLTSLTNNYIHSDHLPPRPARPFINFSSIMSDQYIHVAPFLTAPQTRVFISISLNLSLISSTSSLLLLPSPPRHLPLHPSLSLSLSPLSYINALFPSLPLSPLFPVGFCLHFSVNLPENALAVMKAEGRGNPPGFH